MSSRETALGLSALSLVESLLLELREKGVIKEHDMAGLLDDVMSAHREAAVDSDGEAAEIHLAVAGLVREFAAGGNSVRAVEQLRRDADDAD